MLDFGKGHWGKGLLVALINAAIFIIVPLALKNYDVNVADTKVVISSEFLDKWLICGIPITIISFFTGFYDKGNLARVYATAIQVVVVIAALFFIFSTDVNNIIDVTYKTNIHVSISLAIAGMLLLISISKILKLVIALGDYQDHKTEFKDSTFRGERRNKLLEKLEMLDREKKE